MVEAKVDKRLVLRKRLAEASDDAIMRRYAKHLGRTLGSVRAHFQDGRLPREIMVDLIVHIESPLD